MLNISGRYLLGIAQVITPVELIATTGAGDSFIGAVLYIVSLQCPVSNQNQKELAPNLNKWSQG